MGVVDYEMVSKAIVLGFFVGLFYELLRLVKNFLPHKKIIIAIKDIVFFIVFAVCIFLFYVKVGDGELRLYYIIFAFLGFFAYLFTFGKIIQRILKWFSVWVKKFLLLLYKPFNKIFGVIIQLIANGFSYFNDFLKKTLKSLTKPLIKPNKMLYNNIMSSSKSNLEGSEKKNVIKGQIR